MLILEIALGIVLAVVILNYSPEIISGALVVSVMVVAAIAVLLLILYMPSITQSKSLTASLLLRCSG